ncbi:MAG: hypothetical protein R3D43_06475 [Tepidamorphaceae bacterium]|nr:hypothetical protein [Rhodobiaceae bacterium]MCC0049423.1 hypothetical protein [Rhodobiaceae bacterium]
MKQMRHRNLNLLAAAAFLLAAVLNAYAFRIGSVSQVPADLSAYALPDGTLPELCLSGEGGDNGGHDRSKHCDFCRIIAMPGLPGGPSDTLGVPAFGTSVAYADPVHVLPRKLAVRTPRARGPPAAILS